MATQLSSLNSVYLQHKQNKSPLYDIFKLVINNYSELQHICKLYLSVGTEKSLIKFLCSSDSSFKKFNPNMLEWLRDGDVHLSQEFCGSMNEYILVNVFKDIINGLTQRQISEKHHTSARTIAMCRTICINYLATSYYNLVYKHKSVA